MPRHFSGFSAEQEDRIIDKLKTMLPHGSGIDCAWNFTFLKNGKVLAKNSFHCMTDHGMYDGFADFTVKFSLSKSLSAFDLSFNGTFAQRKNKQYMLRDCLEDCIYHAVDNKLCILNLSAPSNERN